MPTVDSNYVCHDPLDITNPCSFYCPDDNVDTPSNCPKFPPNIYDPTLALSLAYLSSVAYASSPAKCFTNLPSLKAWVLYKVFSSEYCDDANSTCFGYTAVSETEETIVLGFRGTRTISQILFEMIQGFFPVASWPSGGAVIPYFKHAHDSLWPEVQSAITELRAKYPKFKVLVTGHSLGGALATLTASSLISAKIVPTLTLYTFGEPRVGDYNFARTFDAMVPDAWRVIHFIDPFPHIPLCEEIYVNGPIPICNPCSHPDMFSYHHGTEVWYNISSSNFIPQDPHYVCQTGWPFNEALNCSTKQIAYGEECFRDVAHCLAYHSYYFGVSIFDCGTSECTNKNSCNVPN
jgi:hypothetical protein